MTINKKLLLALFKAKLNGRRLTLISRNKNIPEILNNNPTIAGLFSSVIVVGPNEKKSTWVKPYSLFIDDSHKERMDVTKSVPCIALDPQTALELLEGVDDVNN